MDIQVRINVDKSNLSEVPLLIKYITEEKKWGDTVKFYLASVEKQTEIITYALNNVLTLIKLKNYIFQYKISLKRH